LRALEGCVEFGTRLGHRGSTGWSIHGLKPCNVITALKVSIRCASLKTRRHFCLS
jgi:hypothetical protein